VWRHRKPRGTQYTERTEVAAGALELPEDLGEIDIAEIL